MAEPGVSHSVQGRLGHHAHDHPAAVDHSPIMTENSPFFMANPRVPSIGSTTQSRGPSRFATAERVRPLLGAEGVVREAAAEAS